MKTKTLHVRVNEDEMCVFIVAELSRQYRNVVEYVECPEDNDLAEALETVLNFYGTDIMNLADGTS